MLPALPAVPDSGRFHRGLPLQPAAATAAPPESLIPIAQRDAALELPQHGSATEAGVLLRRARIAVGAVAAALLLLLLVLLLLAFLRRRSAKRAARRTEVRVLPCL